MVGGANADTLLLKRKVPTSAMDENFIFVLKGLDCVFVLIKDATVVLLLWFVIATKGEKKIYSLGCDVDGNSKKRQVVSRAE